MAMCVSTPREVPKDADVVLTLLVDDNNDVHGLNSTAKPSGPWQSPPATCVGTARTVSPRTASFLSLHLPFTPSQSRMAGMPCPLCFNAAHLESEQRSRPPATPRRAGSPSSSAQEIKCVKLTVPEQNQGVAPVDPDNAPGKHSELEPVPSGDIVRLQGDEDGEDVSMGEGGMCHGEHLFAPTKGWRCWYVKVNRNQRRFSAVSAFATSVLPGLILAHGHCAEQLKKSPVAAATWQGRANLHASGGGSFGSGGSCFVKDGGPSGHAGLCVRAHVQPACRAREAGGQPVARVDGDAKSRGSSARAAQAIRACNYSQYYSQYEQVAAKGPN
ncbi:hypothetical protein DFH11DRAFT_1787980 [Phellopilus nigrolimitatus]|nr:hypothetical protein DFH11DRAFT_1787980 [Phellopilus nigrolimitatus]